MSSPASALLLGSGELDRIRHLLEELEVRVDYLCSEAGDEYLECGYDLIVTTVSAAQALCESTDVVSVAGKSVWIVFHNQDFLPLRDRLRNLGVNFLVHSCVDDEVLRLLFLHVLYRGPEKRSMLRLPIGSQVFYGAGRCSWPATLLELTRDACQLLSSHAVEPGTPVSVALPAHLSGGKELLLRGRVVRTKRDEKGIQEEEQRICVAFQDPDPRSVQCLAAILEGRAIGTVITPLARRTCAVADHDNSNDLSEREIPEIILEDIDRRHQPRVQYAHRVAAMGGEATRIVLGRDLSLDGMRVEPRPDLRLGSDLRLAVYGAPHEAPVVLDATVTRDDGEHGVLLSFIESDSEARSRLERVVSALPSIESIACSATEERQLVVSKIFSIQPPGSSNA